VTVLVVALALAGRFLLHAGEAGTTPLPRRLPVAAAPTTPAPTLLVVDVVGAVRRAGLQRLPQGSRVADAIARAGGATRRADLAQVNLAAPLADGEQVVVPARGGGGAAPAMAPGVAAGPVHLSTATVEQLDALPGIGPVTAQKIVAYRQEHGAFHSVAELDAISGIGPARIDQLKGLVAP
jgi:competence protein ComEA